MTDIEKPPWEEHWFTRFDDYGGYDCMSAATKVVAEASDVKSGDQHPVVTVDHADYGSFRRRRSAHADRVATFLAAAPDLYRALAECLDVFEVCVDMQAGNPRGEKRVGACVEQARVALRRARGES